MAAPESRTTDALIRAREARGLLWSLVARQVFVGIFLLLAILEAFGLLDHGIVSETNREAVGALVLQLVATGFFLFFMHHARRQTHLTMVGTGAAVVDVLLLSALPVLWYTSIQSPDGTPSFLMKNELFTVCSVVVAINALALRPLYPIIAAAGFIILHVALAAVVLPHPGVKIAWGYIDHFYTPAVNPGVTIVRIIVLALLGGFLAGLASLARKTIHDAVALEVANAEIKERQVEMVLEGKMAALTDLVAGVAHEINTPLGAVRSALDTTGSIASKLSRQEPGPEAERLVVAAETSRRTALTGLERIGRVVDSLKDFSRLDQSEQKLADLRDGLESVLSLVDPTKRGEVEILKHLEEIPPILCRPKELNQVFMTLVINALEAMDGMGTLRVSTAVQAKRARVSIRDTGPGMPRERLDGLFELKFAPKRGRMSFGLGLPTARRIVERHGGTLSVSSVVGEGTEFVMSIPIEP